MRYLSSFNIPYIAITHGDKSLQYLANGVREEVVINEIKCVDTLGVGNIFHGAFCHYILRKNFVTSLKFAAKIASYSCQFFGIRSWIDK